MANESNVVNWLEKDLISHVRTYLDIEMPRNEHGPYFEHENIRVLCKDNKIFLASCEGNGKPIRISTMLARSIISAFAFDRDQGET